MRIQWNIDCGMEIRMRCVPNSGEEGFLAWPCAMRIAKLKSDVDVCSCVWLIRPVISTNLGLFFGSPIKAVGDPPAAKWNQTEKPANQRTKTNEIRGKVVHLKMFHTHTQANARKSPDQFWSNLCDHHKKGQAEIGRMNWSRNFLN